MRTEESDIDINTDVDIDADPAGAPSGDEVVLEAVDRIYSVAIDPDRYDELVDLWLDRLELLELDIGKFEGLLSVHLSRAIDLVSRTGDLSSGDHADLLALELSSDVSASLVVTPCARIQALNAVAARSYGIAAGDAVKKLPFDAASLRVLEEGITEAAETWVELIVRLVRSDTGRAVLIAISPVMAPFVSQPLVLVRSSDVAWSDALGALFTQAFACTSAEVEVIRMMTEGANVAEIATARASSESTVRTQLRTIYEKTQTRGHAELVRMALGLAASHKANSGAATDDVAHIRLLKPEQSPSSPTAPFPRDEHRFHLSLPHDRKMSYSVFGPSDGRVVLHLHDYFSGDVWPATIAQEAIKRGLRVVAPARPLYGGTDPYASPGAPFDQFADDVVRLVDHLKLNEIVVLSRALGNSFVPSITERAPGRIKGWVGVAPALPDKAFAEEDVDSKAQKFILKACSYSNPVLFEFAIRIFDTVRKQFGPKPFMKMVVKNVPEDLAVLEDAVLFEAIERGIRFSRAHGYRAVHRDLKHKSPHGWQWSIDNKIPSHAIIGSKDPAPRIAQAAAMIAAGARMKLTIVEDAGFLVFFSHGQEILDAVEAMHFRNS